MRLEGIHHISAITGDAPGNVDFYTRVMGLRLVAKTVNQDDPDVYHLFYADEQGSPGAELTFFEYPGARAGRAGSGMVHRIVSRVASSEAIDFWEGRLAAEGVATERDGRRPAVRGPRGPRPRAGGRAIADPPLVAEHPEVPAPSSRCGGFVGVRAYAGRADAQRRPAERRAGRQRGGRRLAGAARRAPRRHDRAAIRRRPSGRCRAPAPCTTWRGARRWPSTRRGTSG